jgi:proteasome lid subunit RPN8/RPN11
VVEVGVLIGLEQRVIHWHLPANRTSVALPDSKDLWSQIWDNRNEVLGFAHSHPGRGMPYPSREDVTTFAAIEAALGRELVWWICSMDSVIRLHRDHASNLYSYRGYEIRSEYPYDLWLPRLRVLSYGEGDKLEGATP